MDIRVIKDKVVDEYGNKKCSKCGEVYSGTCRTCCKHNELEGFDDEDLGIMVACATCGRPFGLDELNEHYIIVKKK